MPDGSTQEITWSQPPVAREPIAPLLAHVAWLLRTWQPGELDHHGQLAYVALKESSLRLIDVERDRRALAELLSESLSLACKQNRRADRQYELIRTLRDRIRDQARAAA